MHEIKEDFINSPRTPPEGDGSGAVPPYLNVASSPLDQSPVVLPLSSGCEVADVNHQDLGPTMNTYALLSDASEQANAFMSERDASFRIVLCLNGVFPVRVHVTESDEALRDRVGRLSFAADSCGSHHPGQIRIVMLL